MTAGVADDGFGMELGPLEPRWSGSIGAQSFKVGPDVVEAQLGGCLADLSVNRVAILSSSSARRAGHVDRVRGAVGLQDVEHFSDIPAHAPISRTSEIAAALAKRPPSALISVGGGSVSDTAKGVAILLGEGGTLEEHCSTFFPPDRLESPDLNAAKLPLIAIATTLSAAEITPGGGATTNNGTKRVFWDANLAARFSFYDTSLLGEVPRDVIASTAMNALAHCIEGLYSKTRNPLTDALALAGVRRIAYSLPRVQATSTLANILPNLATGAILSGLVISEARVGLHHAICHVLGARVAVPHGQANAIMLPHVLRYNLGAAYSVFEVLAQELGALSVETVPDKVAAIRSASGAPMRLRDVAVDKSALTSIAMNCMQDRGLYFNPRQVSDASEVLQILEDAW